MILTDRYHQIMDGIQVSPESRQRILQNITGQKKRTFSPARWLTLAAAACILLAAGFSALPQIRPAPVPQRPNRVVGSAGIEPADSPEALSQLVGFPVWDVSPLMADAERVEYLAFHKSLAQITGIAKEDTLIFRQAKGSEDCAAGGAVLTQQDTVEVGGVTVTLKGTQPDSYVSAAWTDDTCTYSVAVTVPRTAAQWQQLLDEIL